MDLKQLEREYFEQFSAISEDERHPVFTRGVYDDKLYQRIDGEWVVVPEQPEIDHDADHS